MRRGWRRSWRAKRSQRLEAGGDRAKNFPRNGDNPKSTFQNDREFRLALRVRAKDGGILILFGNDQPESLLHHGPKSPEPSAYGSTIPLSIPPSTQNPQPHPKPQRNTLTLKKRNKFRFEFDEPSHGSLDTNGGSWALRVLRRAAWAGTVARLVFSMGSVVRS